MDTLNRIIAILSTQQKTQKDLTDYIGLQKGVFTQWKAAGLHKTKKGRTKRYAP